MAATLTELERHCKQCNRRLPLGYLYVVIRWKTIKWGDRPIQVADEVLCRECGRGHVAAKPKPQSRIQETEMEPEEEVQEEEVQEEEIQEEEIQELTPTEVLQKLAPLLSRELAHSSKWLAKQAGLDYDECSETIVGVLKALEKAGKVERQVENGWWRRL